MLNFIINLIFFFLPPSPNRASYLKRFLLRIAGHKIGDNVRVMRIRVQGTKLMVDSNSFIGDETMIMGTPGTIVKIGKNCDISSRVNIITGTHKMNPKVIEKAAGEGYGLDINIGDGVWIGFGSTILGGVHIGKGAMIAAGSVVNKSVPEFCIYGGIPAKLIRKRN